MPKKKSADLTDAQKEEIMQTLRLGGDPNGIGEKYGMTDSQVETKCYKSRGKGRILPEITRRAIVEHYNKWKNIPMTALLHGVNRLTVQTLVKGERSTDKRVVKINSRPLPSMPFSQEEIRKMLDEEDDPRTVAKKCNVELTVLYVYCRVFRGTVADRYTDEQRKVVLDTHKRLGHYMPTAIKCHVSSSSVQHLLKINGRTITPSRDARRKKEVREETAYQISWPERRADSKPSTRTSLLNGMTLDTIVRMVTAKKWTLEYATTLYRLTQDEVKNIAQVLEQRRTDQAGKAATQHSNATDEAELCQADQGGVSGESPTDMQPA